MALTTALRPRGARSTSSGYGSRIRTLRRILHEIVEAFREHDLLQAASAIAFQVLFSTLPLLLLGLAGLSFVGLGDAWAQSWAPEARGRLQPDTFSVLDRAVQNVLSSQRALWLTGGLLLTVWRVSALLRTAARPLNDLYGVEEDRPWSKRFAGSLVLAALVLPPTLLALAGTLAGGEVVRALDLGVLGVVAWLLRWVVVAALLLLVVWLVLHSAPAHEPPHRYVSLGAGLVVAGWIVSTLAYGFYATEVASYGTVFGSLAAVVVLLTAAYLLSIVFLGGVALDARLRERMD